MPVVDSTNSLSSKISTTSKSVPIGSAAKRSTAAGKGWCGWSRPPAPNHAARDADDASLGLGPELALELLEGLHRDAKELGDDTLARAVAVYLDPVRVGAGSAGRAFTGKPSWIQRSSGRVTRQHAECSAAGENR